MLAQNQYATNASPANSAVIQPIGAGLSINQSIIKSYYTALSHDLWLKTDSDPDFDSQGVVGPRAHYVLPAQQVSLNWPIVPMEKIVSVASFVVSALDILGN